MKDRYLGDEAHLYGKEGLTGSFVSAYRPIQHAINQYRPWEFAHQDFSGLKVLDYGAGMGRLLRLIRMMGIKESVGVDTSPSMLTAAKQASPWIPFAQMDKTLPFHPEQFDLVLSTVVLVDIPTRDMMVNYFKEAQRVLKRDGTMIVVTATPGSYQVNTDSFSCDFPENYGLSSGDKAKVVIGFRVPQYDFVWFDEDHQQAISEARLNLRETRLIFEAGVPIWSVYVAGKSAVDWRAERLALYNSAGVFSK